jgi:hypothetical protein
VLRYEFAKELIHILKQGKIIINFDESMIGGTSSQSRSWERRESLPGRAIKRTLDGVAILLAVSSDGIKFFQFL